MCLLPGIASTVRAYRRTAVSGQESGFGDPSYRKGGQQLAISGRGQGNLTSSAEGWMDVGKPHRCRPYGAWVWGVPLFYTDVAPLGLRRGGHHITTQISPRWGSKKDGVIVFYTDFAQVGNQNPLCK